MKILIIGAEGRTGQAVVREALTNKDSVIAFVPDKNQFGMVHPELAIIEGDVLSYAAVEPAMAIAEVVICTIGHDNDSPKDFQTKAIKNIIKAMKTHGLKRLLSLTGAGVLFPKDKPKFIDHAVSFLLNVVSGDIAEDARLYVQEIKNSGLDWTIVRAPRFTDGGKTGAYTVGYVGEDSGVTISRPDVADFIIKEAHENKYIHEAPVISLK